jgi:hypothetical protein
MEVTKQSHFSLSKRLRFIQEVFSNSCQEALQDQDLAALAGKLNATSPEFIAVAFEAASMGLALLDQTTPWKKSRWQTLLDEFGQAHIYSMHVGLGMALAKLNIPIGHDTLNSFNAFFRYLIVDGYGFYLGYFNAEEYIDSQKVPDHIDGYMKRAFDQGLGRSLWFVKKADVRAIKETISKFSADRHADLWSGVGLACTYTGGIKQASISRLKKASGQYKGHLALGAAYAAKARTLSGQIPAHTELACQSLWGKEAGKIAAIVDEVRTSITHDDAKPAYEAWRQQVLLQFTYS